MESQEKKLLPRSAARSRVKHETSKIALAGVLIFCACWLIACLIGWFVGLSEAYLMAAVPTTVAATSVGFYAWKAKAENVIKIRGKDATPEQKQETANILAQQSMTDNQSGYMGY